MDELATLPTEQKQVVAKTLLDLDYSATEIARALKISRASVYRYGEKTIFDDLRQFETEIKAIFAIKQNMILAKILKNMDEITESSNMKELVTAYVALKSHTPSLMAIHIDKAEIASSTPIVESET